MSKQQTKTSPFKICTVCKTVWQSRADFLEDPDVFIIGYQVHFNALTEGLFLFNHCCMGTLSIRAEEFKDLYNGPVFRERLTGTEHCPGYCLHESELAPCPAKCECAFVREIIQLVRKKRKKRTFPNRHEQFR